MKLICSLFSIFLCLASIAQQVEDKTAGFFHDSLLNNFVGIWTATGTVHEQKFENVNFEGEWILNHQFFKIHEVTKDTVPWLRIKYESFLFIGYDHSNKRYTAHLINVFGGDNQLGYILFGKRDGNELKFTSQFTDDSGNKDVMSFSWQQATKSWLFAAKNLNNEKEQVPYLNLKIANMK